MGWEMGVGDGGGGISARHIVYIHTQNETIGLALCVLLAPPIIDQQMACLFTLWMLSLGPD